MLAKLTLFPLLLCLLAIDCSAVTIRYQATDLPDVSADDLYRYSYFISDLSLLENQSIDIRFDPLRYQSLSGGIAGPGFDLLLLQPDNPPGAFGDYDALAIIDNPSLLGTFQIDFVYIGSGQPGSQPFLINRFSDSGSFLGTIAQGVTIPLTQPIPEPGTWLLLITGLATAAVCKLRRSKSS